MLAVWNYAPPEQRGTSQTVTLRFKGMKPRQSLIFVVDPDHGDVHSAYRKMGSPRYPTQTQIEELKKAAELPAPEAREVKNGGLTLTLASYGLALIELK